jgi:glycosyltransferase involved in cell wall biosynthesis
VHAIVANGFAEGPAEALRDYLVARGADVVTIFHPLTPEHGGRHVVTRYGEGAVVDRREIELRVRPPASYALDALVPLLPPRVDTWFGFNPLAAARGLFLRRLRRVRKVVLWSVDFVPDRFGPGTLPTKVYDRLDRRSCLRADARVELSDAARDARNRRHGIDVPAYVVPMGAWLARVPRAAFGERRVTFLGHLVERQGVDLLLDAMRLLPDVQADVIGSGPLEDALRRRAGDNVHFHGFVPDHRDVERLLAGAALAVAPYRPDSFTQYADPGKLKAYLAAGLPIVLTEVPPNAQELAREAGAELIPFDAEALARAFESGLADGMRWRERHDAALRYVSRFDWEVLLGDLVRKLDLRLP